MKQAFHHGSTSRTRREVADSDIFDICPDAKFGTLYVYSHFGVCLLSANW